MKHLLHAAAFIFVFAAGSSAAHAQAVTIPIVFHVVYQNATENIHDTCLQQQIDVLNEDLTANNADLWKVLPAWQPIIGSMQVTFMLASVDPTGNPTTGIERQSTVVNTFSTNDNVKHAATGGLDAWPDTSYLNIWVCDLGSSLTGYTQLPGGPDATDGIVLNYRFTGRGSYAMAPYNLGRVGTHEFGHWLGLTHISPNAANCSVDTDNIPDTPTPAQSVYGGYTPLSVVTDACLTSAPGVMYMNFMTYVDDSSMVFFTQNQLDSMMWVMNNMRQGFFTPNGIREDQVQSKYSVYPSPSATGTFTLTRNDANHGAVVEVYDAQGRLVSGPLTFTAGVSTMPLDLSAAANGVYSVIIRSASATENKRIVIAK